MHKLLILGAANEFVALVRTAQARGIFTIVADGRKGAPAKSIADAAFDVAPFDVEALTRICEDEGVDGIITSYSDVLFECLCTLSQATGIPGYYSPSSMRSLRKKPLMNEMFAHLGIAKANHCLAGDKESLHQAAKLSFPCVVKPASGYGSYGVYVIPSMEDLLHYGETLDPSELAAGLVIEEYNNAPELNMITWVCDGVVHPISIADREKSCENLHDLPYVTRIVYPSRYAEDVCEKATGIAQKIASYLGLKDGPLCLQLFWDPEAKHLQVCEVTGRIFGYEHELVTLGSGLSFEELLIDLIYDHTRMAHTLHAHDISHFTQACCGVYFHGREGAIADMSQARQALSDVDDAQKVFYCAEGEAIMPGPGQKPYVAQAFLQAKTREELDARAEKLFQEFQVFDAAGSSLLYNHALPVQACPPPSTHDDMSKRGPA